MIIKLYPNNSDLTKVHTLGVSDEALTTLMGQVAGDVSLALDKVNPTYKMIAEQIGRKMLYDFEKKAVASGISKEDAKMLRPDKNESPLNKLISIMVKQNVAKMLEDIQISLDIKDNTVMNIEYGTKRNNA